MSDDLIVGLFRMVTPAGTAPAYHAANARRVRAAANARYRNRLKTMFDNDVLDAAAADTPFGAAAEREAARRGLICPACKTVKTVANPLCKFH